MATQVEVKERPILFSGEMVAAILQGRKTQTRRVVKPQPEIARNVLEPSEFLFKIPVNGAMATYDMLGLKNFAERCPYGKPGDRLWVRETWGVGSRPSPSGGYDGIEYRADEALLEGGDDLDCHEVMTPDGVCLGDYRSGWRPSIFMPRWASRISLEITDVRVERVQDISDSDATAEGLYTANECHTAECGSPGTYDPDQTCNCGSRSPQEEYKALWNTINAKRGYGWETNPWVWVIEFKKL